MDALLAMAHGFNDTRLAALRSSGPDSDEEEDAEPQRSPLRTVIVLFLVSTVGLMYWRLALSPLLEPEEGQWLFVLKAALDAAACPECFDGNVLIPTILFLYIWGRLLLRLAGMAAVAALLGSLAYAPWLCLEHRLPAAWDVGGLCRASVPQCQAAVDFAQRGMAAGSDGRYAFVRKRGTVGAMTVREIEHAKRVRGWRRLDLAEDALSPPQELGFDFRWYGQDYDRIQIAADGYMLLLRRGQAAAAPVTTECCAPLDTLHTQPGIALVAPYYTDLDPTILNKENNSGIFAGQLEAGWNYGIYANRLAAAESPLGEGNRPDPRHTASWQVLLTAEGNIRIFHHEANASAHGRPGREGLGVFVGWRGEVAGAAVGPLVSASAANLTHSEDEALADSMLMLGGCSYHDRDFTVEDRDRGVLLAMEEELVAYERAMRRAREKDEM